MSLINTRLLEFRAKSNVDKWETRPTSWGALDLFKQQTMDPGGIISEDLKQKALDSVGSSLSVPVIDFDAGVTVSNQTFPLAITDAANVSQLMSITFTNYYFGFLIHPAAHKNNEIDMQTDFNKKLQKHIYKLATMLDAAALAVLEANKTQVLNETIGGDYALTSNVIVGALATQDKIVGDINPINRGNDFYGPFHVLANPSFESMVRNRLLEKGEFNTEDKRYQYNDKTFHFTNALSNGAGHRATAFSVQAGSVGMLQQFQPDCVMGNSTHKHIWGIENLPILNIPIGTYSYDDAVNASAVHGAASAHLTATKVEAYGFHGAFAFVAPYNSDLTTIPSSIAKFAVATS